jgi:flagella basal body P-ring formation protein FlgA
MRSAIATVIWFLFGIAFMASVARAETLTEAKAESLIRQYVVLHAPWKTENIELRILPFQTPTAYPAEAVFRVIKPPKTIVPGPQNFLLAADAGGRDIARLWVRVEIKVYDDVLVATYPLAHHEMLSADKVRLERRDVSTLAGKPFQRAEDIEGLQASRAVEANEVLTQRSVERPTLMKRGSAVVLVYETGSLRVEAPGVAEEGGKEGDLIQVKNPTSGKVMRGIVLDGRTVKVN